jgi:hypothetical protein
MPPQSKTDSQSGVATSKEWLASSHLSEEVSFWRELIQTLDESRQSRESLERMRQALALAEYRLASVSKSMPTSIC